MTAQAGQVEDEQNRAGGASVHGGPWGAWEGHPDVGLVVSL